MVSFKHFVIVTFLLQLFTCVFCDSNVTEDAKLALGLLNDLVGSSRKLATETAPNLWNSYVSDTNETLHRDMQYNIGNFSVLLNNLTAFANNVTNGTDCLSELGVYLDLNNYHMDVVASEEPVYHNLISLANIAIENIASSLSDLQTEFDRDCVKNTTLCEGTSKLIVAEAERLTKEARRIPYDLLAEIHLLGYRLLANWLSAQANVTIYYNKVIQNATTCLALKFENFKTDTVPTNTEAPENVEESISLAYLEFEIAVTGIYFDTLDYLLYYGWNTLSLCEEEYDSTLVNIRNTIFKVNQTVNSLIHFSQDLNITDITNCTHPDLLDIFSASATRGLKEYERYIDSSTIKYLEGIKYVEGTMNETYNIGLQITDCSSNPDCDLLFEKINRKGVEIPLLLEMRRSATAVLLHEYFLAVRGSGHKILSDVLDQLEASMVILKDCVRESLYS